jgi:hypothetical protein
LLQAASSSHVNFDASFFVSSFNTASLRSCKQNRILLLDLYTIYMYRILVTFLLYRVLPSSGSKWVRCTHVHVGAKTCLPFEITEYLDVIDLYSKICSFEIRDDGQIQILHNPKCNVPPSILQNRHICYVSKYFIS